LFILLIMLLPRGSGNRNAKELELAFVDAGMQLRSA